MIGFRPHIQTAQSRSKNALIAAREFHARVAQPDMGMVIFFCSNQYDLAVLGAELNRLFYPTPLVGCTTAGEIGPGAYCEFSLTGASFPRADFTFSVGRLGELRRFAVSEGEHFARSLLQSLEENVPAAQINNRFAFLMIDGLSTKEEAVAHSFQSALGTVPMVGGSAGDSLGFGNTYVYHEGRFHPNSAVLVLGATSRPIRAFKTQHFLPGNERMVVTDASPENRVVREINGRPAAQEYARLLQVASSRELDPQQFADSPVVVLIDGEAYVRSIQKVNADGSLTFYCAVEDGLVLRIAESIDIYGNLETCLERIDDELGGIQLLLGCDCVLRRLEIRRKGLEDKIWALLNRYRTVGFNTYGEQYAGVHINQTFTGIAFGVPPGDG